ncbi:hypothetical protein GCM10008171_18750 [Methylopila jiangsuensis]|uniref:Uncharacterized protein n=1 Tax=Methylopila jiangsuensis TaxID=586230 RepID=A0A9W6JFG9_9HYPH|nr:hypothetical protein [Methylopila jiangsuensis]MDR6287135.1 hypothetical protein [Methylopila jiangsuensis]GLK76621.1 hypothetical protein GCM10008171_18750 [Methylopila jiangsuensis]
MPPFLVIAAAAAGAVYGAKALRREWRRVNRALDESERLREADERDLRPTLRRDPATGEYRVGASDPQSLADSASRPS